MRSCSPALALAYRTRPVFVPTSGPNDPVARYRTAVMTRLKLIGIGVPVVIGILRRVRRAELLGRRIQLFLHGGSFGVKDPQFGMDLGFYAFDLPFYRMVLGCLFFATFLALIANLLGHYLFGGIRLSGRTGALSRSARIQLISLVGTLVLLKALAYWLDRYELLSHTRAGKPFTGAGYTDINAVLPAKLILLAIALICAAAVFSAIVLRDLRIPAIGVVLLLLSSLIVGAGWPLVVEQISVKPNAAQKESEYISRSITSTRDAYGLTDKTVTYRDYPGNAPATAQQVAADRATTSNIRLLDPTIVSPAFTQFQQGKNFYYFPEQLAIDRYNGPDGNLRDYVVAARELNPDRLIDNQRDWINRHLRLHPRQRLHRLAGQHGARSRQRSQPERRLPGVPGQRRRRQRQRGLARPRAAGPTARLLRPGHRGHVRRLRDRREERQRPRVRLRDQHRNQELHLQRSRWRSDRQLAEPRRVRGEVLRAKAGVPQPDRRPTARSCSIAIRPSGWRRSRRG